MKKVKISISLKTTMLVVFFTLIIIASATFFYYREGKRTNNEYYSKMANSVAKTVAEVVDYEKLRVVKDKVKEIVDATSDKVTSEHWGSDEWYAYSAHFDSIKEMSEYQELIIFLQQMQDVTFEEVDCVYLTYLDADLEYIVVVVDGDRINPCPPGCLDILYAENKPALTDPSIGFPAYITNTKSYGWIVSAGAPVYDDANNIVGYANVDISMEVVTTNLEENTLRLFIFLIVTMVLICTLAVVIIQLLLIRPLHKLTKAAQSYNSNDILTNSFANVKINTHDEIHELSESMKKMEAEINTRLAELMSTNRELITSQHLASEMTKLANKDALTGVGNKTAYEFALEKLKEDLKEGTIQEFGFIMIDLNDLKKNNDTYGHESGNEALKRLCKVVCEVFHHSPVYRIGGDEFVVLLKNRDYERAHHLIDKFYFIINRMNREEGLEASKVISAAVGLAKYDNKVDQTVEDVFNRADEEMYKTKRAMKGEAR